MVRSLYVGLFTFLPFLRLPIHFFWKPFGFLIKVSSRSLSCYHFKKTVIYRWGPAHQYIVMQWSPCKWERRQENQLLIAGRPWLPPRPATHGRDLAQLPLCGNQMSHRYKYNTAAWWWILPRTWFTANCRARPLHTHAASGFAAKQRRRESSPIHGRPSPAPLVWMQSEPWLPH